MPDIGTLKENIDPDYGRVKQIKAVLARDQQVIAKESHLIQAQITKL